MAEVGQQDPMVAVLRERMRRTDIRRAALVALFAGCTALVLVLYIVRPGTGPGGPPLRITVLTVVIVFVFASGALYEGCLVATGHRRCDRLLTLLSTDPGQVERIYAAVVVRVGRSAVTSPLRPPEADHLSRRGPYQIVVKLKDPSRVRRLLSLSTYITVVRRSEVLPLLSFLRGQAPDALGPPIKKPER